MAKVVCPRCFHEADAHNLPFRCLMQVKAVPGGGTPCTGLPDVVQGAFLGLDPATAPELGPVFDKPGRSRRVPCPSCEVPTSVRTCPRCHHDLPGDYAAMPGTVVVLVGSTGVGKSSYATVLLHEMKDRVGAGFDAAVNVMDDTTAKEFGALESALYDHGALPAATTPVSQAARIPLIFRFAARDERRTRRGMRSSAMVFVDSSGEDALDRRTTIKALPHLAHAHGVILLVDPLQFPAVRALMPGPVPGHGTSGMTPDQLVATVAEQIRAGRSLAGHQKVDIPVAVCLSKADLLWPMLLPGSPLLRTTAHRDAFDEADAAEVDDELTALLQRWDGGALRRQLANDFADFSLFCFSALGGPPDGASKAPPEGIHPVRVADPLLWLLSRVGLVPRVREG